MSEREDSIRRIRKLLALAARGGTEQEANNAAARAAQIMALHGIESVEIEGDPDPIGDNMDLFVDVVDGNRRPPIWKWNMAWTVATSGRCKPYYLDRKIGTDVVAKMIGFVGRRSDAQMCCYVLEYLISEIKSAHDRKRPKVGSRIQQYVPGAREPIVIDRAYQRRWSRDFYLGAVAALHQRMVAASDEVMKTANSTALVLLRDVSEDVDRFASDMGLKFVKAAEVNVQADNAYALGVLAGRNVDLTTEPGLIRIPLQADPDDT